jgi:hypothetical protein
MQSVIVGQHGEVVLEQGFEKNIWTGETGSKGGPWKIMNSAV